MISSETIGVNKIVPFRETPIPTKVDPSKVDISTLRVCHSDAQAKRGRRNLLFAGSGSGEGCPILAASPQQKSPGLKRQGWDFELREIQSKDVAKGWASARFIYLGNEASFPALEQGQQLFWAFDFVFGL
jgi:hypothetical protein